MIVIVNKDYKVSARIMIQDGTSSHIRRFKTEMEFNGDAGDPALQQQVLGAFSREIASDAEQMTLTAPDKTPLAQKKPGKKEQGAG